MGSMLSIETLFWAPLAMDVMLLVGTYSACNLKGLGWFLDEMKKHSIKKNDDNDFIQLDGDISEEDIDDGETYHDLYHNELDLFRISYNLPCWINKCCYDVLVI